MVKNMKKILVGIFVVLFSLPAMAVNVSGSVHENCGDSNTGTPMVGVAVVEVGTTHGTTTDPQGKFTLRNVASNDSEIEFSFLGFTSKTLLASELVEGVVVCLESTAEVIDDVIVAPISDIVVGEDDDILYPSWRCSGSDWDREVPDKIAIKDGKILKFNKNVYGIYTGEIKDSGALRNNVESRNVYFAYVGDKFVGPIAVLNTKTIDGVTRAEVTTARYWNRDMYIHDHDTKDIIINRDLEKSDLVNGVFGLSFLKIALIQ